MKRRSFIWRTLAALFAPAVAVRSKSFLVILEASEWGGEVYTAEGSTVALAMANLKKEIEACTCEFDEYFGEVFAESTAELVGGARRASHWDFSCPESAYTITVRERLEGGRLA